MSKSLKNIDLSGVPAAVKGPLEIIMKANQELIEKNAKLEAEVRSERELRTGKEFVAKASKLTHLGAKTEDVAQILKSLTEKDPEQAAKFEAILNAADNQIKAGHNLYGEFGTRVSKAAAGTPEAQMQAMVDSFVQKSDGKKSRAEIEDDLFQNNAEYKKLYSEYMAHHPGMKSGS